jgi:hypothetical protein
MLATLIASKSERGLQTTMPSGHCERAVWLVGDIGQAAAGKRAATPELSGDRVPKTAFPPLAFILILRIQERGR